MTERYLVIKEHCPKDGVLGFVVEVDEILPPVSTMWLRCSCGAIFAQNEAHALILGHKRYHPATWLKKLPPAELLKKEEEEHVLA